MTNLLCLKWIGSSLYPLPFFYFGWWCFRIKILKQKGFNPLQNKQWDFNHEKTCWMWALWHCSYVFQQGYTTTFNISRVLWEVRFQALQSCQSNFQIFGGISLDKKCEKIVKVCIDNLVLLVVNELLLLSMIENIWMKQWVKVHYGGPFLGTFCSSMIICKV